MDDVLMVGKKKSGSELACMCKKRLEIFEDSNRLNSYGYKATKRKTICQMV